MENKPSKKRKTAGVINAQKRDVSMLPESVVHRFLLLFLRLDGKKAGTLARGALEEIAYMPLGVLSAEIQRMLAASSSLRSLSVNAWLDIAVNLLHQTKDKPKGPTPSDLTSIEHSLNCAETLPLCFPPVNLGGASNVLDLLDDSSLAGADLLFKTLAFAAAAGSAAVCRFIMDTFKPCLTQKIQASEKPILLSDVLSLADTGISQFPEDSPIHVDSCSRHLRDKGNYVYPLEDSDDEGLESAKIDQEAAKKRQQDLSDVAVYFRGLGCTFSSDLNGGEMTGLLAEAYAGADGDAGDPSVGCGRDLRVLKVIDEWLCSSGFQLSRFPFFSQSISKGNSPERLCDSQALVLLESVKADTQISLQDACLLVRHCLSLNRKVPDHILRGNTYICDRVLCALANEVRFAVHPEFGIAQLVVVLDMLGSQWRRKLVFGPLTEQADRRLSPEGGHHDRVQKTLYCQVCQRVVVVSCCGACGVAAYCSVKHQAADAKMHRSWCESLLLSHLFTLAIRGEDYKEIGVRQPTLAPSFRPKLLPKSWADFFDLLLDQQDCAEQNHSAQWGASVSERILATEPLSFVMSVVFALDLLGWRNHEIKRALCIHFLGADRETAQNWEELVRWLPLSISRVTLCFIGPSVQVAETDLPPEPSGGFKFSFSILDGDKSSSVEEKFHKQESELPDLCGNHVPVESQQKTDSSGSSRLKFVYRKGMYHDVYTTLPPSDVVFALNSGMHHYESWNETLDVLLAAPKLKLPPSASPKIPIVVTAWSQQEALIARELLLGAGGRVCQQLDLQENPYGSAFPNRCVDDHGTNNFSNRFIVGVM